MPRVRAAVTGQVVQEVASAMNAEPLELPPLYEAIDPDALEGLVETMTDGEVSFTYRGHKVTVSHDGTVDVDEPTTRGTSTGLAEGD